MGKPGMGSPPLLGTDCKVLGIHLMDSQLEDSWNRQARLGLSKPSYVVVVYHGALEEGRERTGEVHMPSLVGGTDA